MAQPSRRDVLKAAGLVLGGLWVARALPVRAQAVEEPPFPIHRREEWGADLAPKGPLEVEAPGDVRFLLVHHSVSGNDYAPEAVAPEIRSFYALHTGPEKGWPDVAYNFFVDRFGEIWEGRQGSVGAPVKASATGG